MWGLHARLSIYWFQGSSKYDLTLGDKKLPRPGLYRALPFSGVGEMVIKSRPDILKVWWTKVSANINIIYRIYSSWIPNSSGHQYDVCFLIEGNLRRFLTKSCVVVPRLRWANLWWPPTLGNEKVPLKFLKVERRSVKSEQLKLPVHRL